MISAVFTAAYCRQGEQVYELPQARLVCVDANLELPVRPGSYALNYDANTAKCGRSDGLKAYA
jgi:hypothetical protein